MKRPSLLIKKTIPRGAIAALFTLLVSATTAFLLTIDGPGATFTTATGINAGGDIVGVFRDSTGNDHGFLAQGF